MMISVTRGKVGETDTPGVDCAKGNPDGSAGEEVQRLVTAGKKEQCRLTWWTCFSMRDMCLRIPPDRANPGCFGSKPRWGLSAAVR